MGAAEFVAPDDDAEDDDDDWCCERRRLFSAVTFRSFLTRLTMTWFSVGLAVPGDFDGGSVGVIDGENDGGSVGVSVAGTSVLTHFGEAVVGGSVGVLVGEGVGGSVGVSVSNTQDSTVFPPIDFTAPLLILAVTVEAALVGMVASMMTLPAEIFKETWLASHPAFEASSDLILARSSGV